MRRTMIMGAAVALMAAASLVAVSGPDARAGHCGEPPACDEAQAGAALICAGFENPVYCGGAAIGAYAYCAHHRSWCHTPEPQSPPPPVRDPGALVGVCDGPAAVTSTDIFCL